MRRASWRRCSASSSWPAPTGSPFEFDEEWAEEVFEARGPVGDVFAFFMNDLGGGVFGVFVVPILTAVVLLICRRPWGALYFICRLGRERRVSCSC